MGTLTVRDALAGIFEQIRAEGGPLFAVGDSNAIGRDESPYLPTIMLDDSQEGWYIRVAFAPIELTVGDSMRAFATHVAGYLNVDVALPRMRSADVSDLNDEKILDLCVRCEPSSEEKASVNVSLVFECNGIPIGAHSLILDLDLKKHVIERWRGGNTPSPPPIESGSGFKS